MEVPSDYYRPSAVGCAGALTTLAALGTGIYRGLCAANGTHLNSGLENVLAFGPSVLSIPLSIGMGKKLSSDPRIMSQFPQMSEEQRQSAAGCGTGCSTIGMAGTMYLLHQVGYAIGSWLGANTK